MQNKSSFTCSVCGNEKPIQREGGTGYGRNDKNELICYDCCAITDRADMAKSGTAILYDGFRENGRHVTNWPGTLAFKVGSSSISRHNIAGVRYDMWFNGPKEDGALGTTWHGVRYGDNTQIVHCKRSKREL